MLRARAPPYQRLPREAPNVRSCLKTITNFLFFWQWCVYLSVPPHKAAWLEPLFANMKWACARSSAYRTDQEQEGGNCKVTGLHAQCERDFRVPLANSETTFLDMLIFNPSLPSYEVFFQGKCCRKERFNVAVDDRSKTVELVRFTCASMGSQTKSP